MYEQDLQFTQFCDGCGRPTALLRCSEDSCRIGMCYDDKCRTGCVTLKEPLRLWFCPRHNVPTKVKVCFLHRTGNLQMFDHFNSITLTIWAGLAYYTMAERLYA